MAAKNRIVATADVLDGEPRVVGRRLGVLFVRDQVEGRGLTPRTVADRHGLDVAAVYSALAYYHEHPGEMAALRSRRVARQADAAETAAVATGPADTDRPSE